MKQKVRTSVLSAASLGVFAVVAGLLPLPTPADAGALPPLDHFKCYQTGGPPLAEPIDLKDQFDPTFVPARVLAVTRFCNPVQKTHNGIVTPIRDPNGHLKLYAIETTTAVSPRTVLVTNQFGGNQQLRVTGPQGEILAVPTQKLPHPPSGFLDHFKCYPATGPNPNTTVRLQDQFANTRNHALRRPVLFCNPTEKIHNGVFTPIQHPADHLTCYKITARPFSRDVLAINQFGTENLVVRDADLLCVPTLKLGFSP